MSADGLERVWFLNTLVVIRVPSEHGTDTLCVMEHLAPTGDSPPLHVHHDQDEVFALLAGEARFHLSGRDIEARTGDCFLVPKGEAHSYLATSAEGVRFLTITRGNGFVGLVREVGRAAKTDGLPELALPPSPEEQGALVHIAGKHGVEFVGRRSVRLEASHLHRFAFLVDHKTLDRLTAIRGPGESYSDVILRLAEASSRGVWLLGWVRVAEDQAGAIPNLETVKGATRRSSKK
jgi:mannose-6-phosphate isomerase-like protein (cupin superfamily)